MEIRPILSALLRNKTGAVLVAIQVAISLAILSNALHIVNVRQAVAARPSGIADEESVFHIGARHLKPAGHNEQLATQARETDALRSVQGVLSVAMTNQVPLSRSGSTNGVALDRKQANESASAAFYISPDSLIKTWGLKLVEGRDFEPADVLEFDEATSSAFPKTVIVTKALAEKLFPGSASVVGKSFFFGTGEDAQAVRILGVVERLQSTAAQVNSTGEYATIVAMRMTGPNAVQYTVRVEPGQRDRVMREAQAALRKVSSDPVITKLSDVTEHRGERYRADIALSWMLITVSVLLLLITASGIVGMASLWVTQRRKQIGVRRALGARRTDILRYFVTENIMITSAGVTAGVLLAIALNQLLVSQLEMARLPLGYLGAGAGVFWALGIVAVYGPAWRAASTSPALATRSA